MPLLQTLIVGFHSAPETSATHCDFVVEKGTTLKPLTNLASVLTYLAYFTREQWHPVCPVPTHLRRLFLVFDPKVAK